jgi:hypothetical protein
MLQKYGEISSEPAANRSAGSAEGTHVSRINFSVWGTAEVLLGSWWVLFVIGWPVGVLIALETRTRTVML